MYVAEIPYLEAGLFLGAICLALIVCFRRNRWPASETQHWPPVLKDWLGIRD